MRWLALVLVLLGSLAAGPPVYHWPQDIQAAPASEPPSPAPLEPGQKPQAESAPANQQTNTDQRGTEEVPLVVKIAPAPEAQPESSEQRNAREQQSSQDRWTLVFAGLTTLFTGALVGVGGGQLLMFYRQLGYMRDGMQETKTAAEAARDAANAAKEQATTAREEFLATHRPRIGVRYMQLTKMQAGEPLEIQFNIVNVGGSQADIVQRGVEFMYLQHRFSFAGMPDFRRVDIERGKFVLTGGQNQGLTETDTGVMDSVAIDAIRTGAVLLHVLGVISYADASGVVRRTGYFRRYDTSLRRFMPATDQPEYEYED